MDGKFDDLIAIGEAVDELGDAPPTPEQNAQLDKAAQEVAESSDFEVDEQMSGGLSEVMETEDEVPTSLDELLGVPKGEDTEEQEQEVDEPAAKEESAAPTSEPSGTDERIKELTDRLNRAEENNSLLIKNSLRGAKEEPAKEGGDTGAPDELEDDVKDYLRPYIDAEVKERMAPLEQQLAPLKVKQDREAVADQVSKHIKGFKANHVELMEEAYKTLPENEQALYKTGGLAGAILLAQRLDSEGKLGLAKTPRRTSNKTSRHHSETSGEPPAGIKGQDDKALAKRLDNMPDDEFLKLLERFE